MTTQLAQIQLRRDLAANWTGSNPTLAAGEFGYELDTRLFKVGDGSTPWVSLAYNGAGNSGGLATNGTRAAPNLVTAGGGISVLEVARELQFIAGNGGNVTVTVNPAIPVGTKAGQELILQGTDNARKVTLNTGNGLDLNGAVVLGAGARIYLVWDGVVWGEVSRK
jgi:hypothetical protein